MVRYISSTFTITIKRKDESYTIEANNSKEIQVDPQPAPQLKTLLFDEQIKATLNDLANDRGTATPHAIQKLGKALYDALFIQPVLLAFGKVQGRVRNENGVRLWLQIEPPELATLPWETLYDGQDWLSTQSTTPLVRQLILEPGSETLRKLKVRGALKILFVGASPKDPDLTNLNIEKTATELGERLEESIKKKKIVFDVLLKATLQELQEELLKDYHILYFAGHGSPEGIFLDDGGGKSLKEGDKVVGREKGYKHIVSAETLAQALEGKKQTRLVFLAACNTSTAPDESDLLSGFAQELAQRSKLPAIVAMQYFISYRQANPLTTQFFAALAAYRPVDVALAEARKPLIKKEIVGRDVFSPVLYLQAEDGALFQKAKNGSLWGLVAISPILIILMIFSYFFWKQSERQRAISELPEKVIQVQQMQSIDSLSTLIFAIEATGQSLDQLKFVHGSLQSIWHDAVKTARERNRFSVEGIVSSIAISKDGNTIVVGTRSSPSEPNLLYIWENINHIAKVKSVPVELKGADDSTFSVAISPDGQSIISGHLDGTLRLWDLNLKPIKTFQERNNAGAYDMAFSPDGNTIVSSDGFGEIQWWDSNGNLINSVEGHDDSIVLLTFTSNGERIISIGNDSRVRLWDIKGNPQGNFLIKNQCDAVFSAATNSDGQKLITGCRDKTLKLWKVKNDRIELENEFKGHKSLVTFVSLSPDGQYIATGHLDGTIRLWNFQGSILQTLVGHKENVISIVFGLDGKTLVSGSADSTVRLWDIEDISSNQLSHEQKDNFINQPFQAHDSSVSAVGISSDRQTIVSGSQDKTVRIWNNKGKPIGKTFEEHGEAITAVAISPDGKMIYSGSKDKTVRVSDRQGNFKKLFRDPITQSSHGDNPMPIPFSNQPVTSISISPNGNYIVSSFIDNMSPFTFISGQWNLWNQNGTHISQYYAPYIKSVAVSNNGKYIVGGLENGQVVLWNKQGNSLGELYRHEKAVTSVAISADGNTIVSGSKDKTVKLWERQNKSPKIFRKHEKAVTSVAISADGNTIVSGSEDETVKLKDRLGNSIGQPFHHQKAVNSVAISVDGQTIISGSEDGTIGIWQGSNWKKSLQLACNRLRHHRIFKISNENPKVINAKKTCQKYVWSKRK